MKWHTLNKVFPRSVSFTTGWMMILAYFIVCPWEAVAVGKIAGYIFPALDSMELYRIAGRPVYCGIFHPCLRIARWYRFSWFYKSSSFFKAIWMAIVVGILFYTIVIAAVGYVAPWKQLTRERFMTAVAFERAVDSRWIVSVILAAALLSLFKVFNGNFVAASRLLFAMGRRGLVDQRLGHVHPHNQTPFVAVHCVGVATAACLFLGDAALVAISEVGSVASAMGWLAACVAYCRMASGRRERFML